MERAWSWSVLLFYSWPALTPNRISWSKSSLGVLSFKNQQQNKKEMHDLRDCRLVKLLLLYWLQWSDAKFTPADNLPWCFTYSWSPLKNIPSSPGNFPQTFEVSPPYILLNISLNKNGNNTVSLHGKRPILPNFSEQSDDSIYCDIS